MSLSAGLVGVLAGTMAGLAAPSVLRRLQSPEPDVQAQYRALAGSHTARPSRVVVSSVVCALLAARLGWSAALPLWLLLGAVGTLLSEIDWCTRRLPAAVVNPTLLVAVLLIVGPSLVTADWAGLAHAGAGWAAAAVLFGLLWLASPRSLGYGDVRLGALLGLALGWSSAAALLSAFFLTLVLAAAVGLAMRVAGRLGADGMIPLGPFLIAGSVAAVLIQPI